jgi:hypothetical protein
MKLLPFFTSVCLTASTVVEALGTFYKSNITLAAVVAAPPGWPLPVGNKNWTGHHCDLDVSIDYAVRLIGLGKSRGADLVAFPESWFLGRNRS